MVDWPIGKKALDLIKKETALPPESREPGVLIATLPKSGTWYCHCFFYCYAAWLNHYSAEGQEPPDLVAALRDNRIGEVSHPDIIGVRNLYICHSACPGYSRMADDPLRAEWERLRFHVPAHDIGKKIAGAENWEALEPQQNPRARIVYLHRNPLDQMVSLWRHLQSHIDVTQRMKLDAQSKQVPIVDFHDFVFNASALDSFIKQYHTFQTVRERYPQNILMVPYEQLVSQPEECFTRILEFIGHPVNTPSRRQCMRQALGMTGRNAMMEAENALGRALANDQVSAAERHVRDGAIGKWRQWFNEPQLAAAKNRLARFRVCAG